MRADFEFACEKTNEPISGEQLGTGSPRLFVGNVYPGGTGLLFFVALLSLPTFGENKPQKPSHLLKIARV